MAPADPALLQVEVVYAAAPHRVERIALRLPAGASAADALRASGLLVRLGAPAADGLALGIWGRMVEPATPLRDRDRVELYRPLSVDPKEARRLRYRRDGVTKPAPAPRRPR